MTHGIHDDENDLHDLSKEAIERKLDSYANDGEDHHPGTLPEDLYEQTLAWWRLRIRRIVMSNLEAESRGLAKMQVRLSPLFFY